MAILFASFFEENRALAFWIRSCAVIWRRLEKNALLSWRIDGNGLLVLSPRGSRRILRGTCGNLHAMQCNGHLAHSIYGRFYNAIDEVVEVHHGPKSADMHDVIALPHFGRTERALSRHRGPNDVCSFSSPFLSLAFSISLLR